MTAKEQLIRSALEGSDAELVVRLKVRVFAYHESSQTIEVDLMPAGGSFEMSRNCRTVTIRLDEIEQLVE